jgi:hypothetical protein
MLQLAWTVILFILSAWLGWQMHATTPSFYWLRLVAPELFAHAGLWTMILPISAFWVAMLLFLSFVSQFGYCSLLFCHQFTWIFCLTWDMFLTVALCPVSQVGRGCSDPLFYGHVPLLYLPWEYIWLQLLLRSGSRFLGVVVPRDFQGHCSGSKKAGKQKVSCPHCAKQISSSRASFFSF